MTREYTQPAQGFLVGPPDAPDEVVDVQEYNRAMDALMNADARVNVLEKALHKIVDNRYLFRLADARRIAREALEKDGANDT